MLGVQLPYGNGCFGLGVLDDVALVQNEIFQWYVGEDINIVSHNIIRGDDDIMPEQLGP